jgi:hypothetical protein
MFCMRSVREAYPEDPNGIRFAPSCEGATVPDTIRDDERAKSLVALLDRRQTVLAALDQVLGEAKVDKSQTFAEDELKEWTWKLLPFYTDDTSDATQSKLLPRSTQALAKVMDRLSDPDDPDAATVRETISRISGRLGYRAPERVLAAVRPALTYERIDELVTALLGLVAEGKAHDVFLKVLEGTALELAEPAEEKQNPSTLRVALDLMLQPDPLYVAAEADRTLEPLLVLERDDEGNAIPVGDPSATPFPVAGREDSAARASVTALALSSAGDSDGYKTFDANHTALASLMRDSIPLIKRGDKPRSTVENALRSLRPLLGPDTQRTETFGGKTVSYTGPDVENGPMGKFLHSLATMLKLPQTKPLLQVVDQLVATNEAAATELISAVLAIDAQSDMMDFNNGKLTGPNEFWDDLIGFAQRIIAEKPGLLLDILKATQSPLTAASGKILGHQMMYKDSPKLASDTDINSDPVSGCQKPDGAAVAPVFCVPVDRSMSGADVGMNRSLFQRTLTLSHTTNKAPNCNKEGATLTVQEPVPTTFPNPPLGPLAPIIGGLGGGSGDCPTSTVAPPPATSYKKCALIEQKNGTVTLLRAMLGKGKLVVKDDEVTKCAQAVGTKLDQAQEKESGIKGFTLSPTPKALARFIQAPRKKFLTDMFDPFQTIDKVAVIEYEPNIIYALEMVDPEATVDGVPQSFITATNPLLSAFDAKDTIDANGDPVGDYLFAELLSLVHKHYSSPKALCPEPYVPAGNEGCVQSVDPTKPFFTYGSNIVSYEPLVAWALLEQDLLGVLQRSTSALAAISVDGKDGVTLLSEFLEAALKPNPDFKYKDGRSYAKTNLCSGPDSADATKCACPAGAEATQDGLFCKNADGTFKRRGRIIAGGVPPLYPMLDALNDIDTAWSSDEERHKIFLDVRSTLVDQLLTVAKDAEGKTRFKNRRAYALTRKLVPWLIERINAHQGDLVSWAEGLTDRAAGVIAHPIGARAIDLFDEFWDNKAAGDEVASLLEYLLDEDKNPEAFTGTIIALADTLTFFDKDPDLTPAIRFAALAVAGDALDAVNNGGDDPNVDEGTAYRFLEVTRAIAKADEGAQLSTLAKLLRNAVLPMSGDLSGKSPLEVIIDLVADTNRKDPTLDSTLSADDNLKVFKELSAFLSDPDVGLERLYAVIENRELQR